MPLFKALQVDHLQHLHDTLVDLLFRQLDFFPLIIRLRDTQAKGHVLIYVQVGKQGILLEYRVHRPFMGRNSINPHTVKKNIARGGRLKTTNDSECGGLAAPAGTQQCEEFLVVDIQIDSIQHHFAVKGHGAVGQTDQLLGHLAYPPLV